MRRLPRLRQPVEGGGGAPNLPGQNELYLVEQLNAFRRNEMMSIMIKDMSLTDIETLPPITLRLRSRSKNYSNQATGDF
jgi:cytochrome c553